MRQERIADIMVILGVVFMLIAHGVTNFSFWYLQTNSEMGTTAKQFAQAYEANPLAIGLVSDFHNISYMLSYIFQPALLIACYYLIRKKYLQAHPAVIMFIGVFVLMAGFLNAFNDLANLLGLLLSKGLV